MFSKSFCGTHSLDDWASVFLLGRMFLFVLRTSLEDTTFCGKCYLAIVVLAFGRGHLARTKVVTFIFERRFAL